jgi:ferredoxin-like protein FixX
MDGMPGWKKAFGNQYLKDLRAQLKKDKMLYSFRITDIKEKYGTLRLYCACASEAVYRIIDKYEDLSYNTCIECGEPAKIITDGYVLPYCEHCYREKNIKYKPMMVRMGDTWCDSTDITIGEQKNNK